MIVIYLFCSVEEDGELQEVALSICTDLRRLLQKPIDKAPAPVEWVIRLDVFGTFVGLELFCEVTSHHYPGLLALCMSMDLEALDPKEAILKK